MSGTKWLLSLKIYRKRENQRAYYQKYTLEADPDEYVLDLVERVWAQQDRSLTYRHACHHSTCGACGMLINGKEKLTCITPVNTVAHNGGEIKIEPLKNFPVLSDLVVDMGRFFLLMEGIKSNQVVKLNQACLPFERKTQVDGNFERLVDCIECGLCISACPAATTNSDYLGPAVLAAAQQEQMVSKQIYSLNLMDSHIGAWRCHSAFECSEVCPSAVDPGWRIMDLRKKIFAGNIKRIFSGRRRN